MISLRNRVALGVLASQLAILGGGGYFAYRSGRRVLTTQFDESLASKAATFATLLEQRGKRVEFHFADELMLEYVDPVYPEYFQIWTGEGESFERSYALRRGDLPFQHGILDDPMHWDHELPDGRGGRLVGLRVQVHEVEPDPKTGESHPPEEIVIVLAKGREGLDQLLSRLVGGLLSAGALLLVLGLIVVTWAVRVSLGPVATLGQEMRGVDAATVSGLTMVEQYPSELTPVVSGLNELRHRLGESLRAERRTAGNIAHELKTPISELRALTEVALQDGTDHEFNHRALQQAFEISIQMERLVEVVRTLTRIDSGRKNLSMERLPVGDMLASAIATVAATVEERELSLVCDGSDGSDAWTNREALMIILSNLIRNAVEYSPPRSEIRWKVAERGDHVSVRITNPCSGLRREHLEHLSEPFWRASNSRTDAQHHGLGLTLASGMAELAGISLAFEMDGDSFIARVSIPDREAVRTPNTV